MEVDIANLELYATCILVFLPVSALLLVSNLFAIVSDLCRFIAKSLSTMKDIIERIGANKYEKRIEAIKSRLSSRNTNSSPPDAGQSGQEG